MGLVWFCLGACWRVLGVGARVKLGADVLAATNNQFRTVSDKGNPTV
jgi:hypothetical protein